jgi:uncharacterized YigZ family protein
MNLFEDHFLVPAKAAEAVYRDRGSKFLGFVYPVQTEAEVKSCLLLLRKQHPGANHHCYAFRLGADKLFFRNQDDGEPSGTAGRPILGQIQSRDLTNVLVVVVRYFGGTLLGVSGLIAAYKGAAHEALEEAGQTEKCVQETYLIEFGHETMNEVMRIVKNEGLKQSSADFGLVCQFHLTMRKQEAERILTLLGQVKGLVSRYVSTE